MSTSMGVHGLKSGRRCTFSRSRSLIIVSVFLRVTCVRGSASASASASVSASEWVNAHEELKRRPGKGEDTNLRGGGRRVVDDNLAPATEVLAVVLAPVGGAVPRGPLGAVIVPVAAIRRVGALLGALLGGLDELVAAAAAAKVGCSRSGLCERAGVVLLGLVVFVCGVVGDSGRRGRG
jgi:hypothetical protein